jgi:hypothetical protein
VPFCTHDVPNWSLARRTTSGQVSAAIVTPFKQQMGPASLAAQPFGDVHANVAPPTPPHNGEHDG